MQCGFLKLKVLLEFLRRQSEKRGNKKKKKVNGGGKEKREGSWFWSLTCAVVCQDCMRGE